MLMAKGLFFFPDAFASCPPLSPFNHTELSKAQCRSAPRRPLLARLLSTLLSLPAEGDDGSRSQCSLLFCPFPAPLPEVRIVAGQLEFVDITLPEQVAPRFRPRTGRRVDCERQPAARDRFSKRLLRDSAVDRRRAHGEHVGPCPLRCRAYRNRRQLDQFLELPPEWPRRAALPLLDLLPGHVELLAEHALRHPE